MGTIRLLTRIGLIFALCWLSACAGDTSERSSASCEATTVHPDGGPVHTPWVDAGGGVQGALFFYPTEDAHDGVATLPAGGVTAEGKNAKVLWVVSQDYGAGLTVEGRRTDAPGSYSAVFGMATSPKGHFPSIIELPSDGCWNLTLTSGDTRGEVTFLAV